mmetsp:Transcript_2348/g.3366  ORF Transcript_2348/g.3366 Transcript_2348/m.3366 type:complete len:578 (+) Transcript_2348:142-1875(+)|eukprot:CAMPEP_0171456270 /NCGR_PEP_ID=MMETSP0945-20130129/2821_1 /TAXON_ID=109269 /ORGANISM="Vaucheria litorea, Strain CCMP2940" /LENGTH=577 /DNA_ID=CAMNT_0011981655 /DNA_START=135 /DNA_END=1868 /DNA_ORIENTATION=-
MEQSSDPEPSSQPLDRADHTSTDREIVNNVDLATDDDYRTEFIAPSSVSVVPEIGASSLEQNSGFSFIPNKSQPTNEINLREKIASMKLAAGAKFEAVQQTFGSLVSKKEEQNVRKEGLIDNDRKETKEYSLTFENSALPFQITNTSNGIIVIYPENVQPTTNPLPGTYIVALQNEKLEGTLAEELSQKIATLENFELTFREEKPKTSTQSDHSTQSSVSTLSNKLRALTNDIHQSGVNLIGGLNGLLANKGENVFSEGKNFENKAISSAVGFIKLLDVQIASKEAIPFTLKSRAIDGNVILEEIDKNVLPNDQKLCSELGPGATLLSVAGQPANKRTIEEINKIINEAAFPIVFTFSGVPPLYRPEKAMELAKRSNFGCHLHMGTWFPMPTTTANAPFEEVKYDGVHDAARRALRFLDGLRSHGIEVELKSLETVVLPRTFLSGHGPYDGVLRDGSGPFSDLPKGNWQAARMWFSFPSAITITVQRSDDERHSFGLEPVRDGTDGSWIVVRVVPGSPCAKEVPDLDSSYILTNVNGIDTCPEIFRSLAPRRPGPATFERNVKPMLEGVEKCTFTLV